MDLLQFTEKGIWCAPAKVYLDPWKAVEKALITHGHSDHSRWGNKAYLAHKDSEAVMRHRLGHDIKLQTVDYGEVIDINGVKFSFFPAGHVIGSAQIRVEYKGEVWVYTGDYKLEDDGFSAPFESVKCDTFITESTFALPVYRWKPQNEIFDDVNEWWAGNAEQGICSVIFAYSLGKAQRVLVNVNREIGPIYTHGAVAATNNALVAGGLDLPAAPKVDPSMSKDAFRKALIIAPPSAQGTPWMRRFEPYSIGVASGWMNIRGARRWRAADRGFPLSDHADWADLNRAVEASGASKVIVTHGYTSVFARWLCEKGLEAKEAHTEYASEPSEIEGEETTE